MHNSKSGYKLRIGAQSYCYVVIYSSFFRLQPASRHLLTTGIFEQEFGSKCKCCKCEYVPSFPFHTLVWKCLTPLISSGCVMTECPSTGWLWPSSCLPCGTVFIQGTISPLSLPSPSRWQHEMWVLCPLWKFKLKLQCTTGRKTWSGETLLKWASQYFFSFPIIILTKFPKNMHTFLLEVFLFKKLWSSCFSLSCMWGQVGWVHLSFQRRTYKCTWLTCGWESKIQHTERKNL